MTPLGITITSGSVSIEKCVIHNINNSRFAASTGISVQSISQFPVVVSVSDTVIRNNGDPTTGIGIAIGPPVSPITKVVLNRVEVRGNFFGIKAIGGNYSGNVINMTIRDSVSSGNGANGIVGTGTASGAVIVMMIDHSTSSHNGGFGVIADGPKTTIRMGNSSIAGNIDGVGVSNGGVLQSYGTNRINGNSSDGIASLTPIGLH
ncbi:MAG: hypothetical protein JOZ40_03285 [Methylobacteriaceae bacterium]|nr:hypothetical protein [Methylobacteriaceae bacterium]